MRRPRILEHWWGPLSIVAGAIVLSALVCAAIVLLPIGAASALLLLGVSGLLAWVIRS